MFYFRDSPSFLPKSQKWRRVPKIHASFHAKNIQSSLRHLTDFDNFWWVGSLYLENKVCQRILPKYFSFGWYRGPKFRFFQKSRKMGIERNNFFNQFKLKNQFFLWLEYKKDIENLILRPLRPLSKVIIPPTSSVIKN